MVKINISNTQLKRMLNISKRKQTVNGKQQAQVESCVLMCDGGKARITSLTRDLTGLTEVTAECEGLGRIPIPDIDRVLGILSLHRENLVLSWEEGKLRFKSTGKQTTLDSSFDAKAFTHSQETINDFALRSETLANKIDAKKGIYTLGDGAEQHSFCSFEVNVSDLYDACRCDTINGQRLNRYTFKVDLEETLEIEITVGDPMLGQTTSIIPVENPVTQPIHPDCAFTWDFDGGLDELFKGFTGKATLNFFDFREHGQGIRFSVYFGSGEWAWAAGALK
jgi:hypothetical protein